MTYGCHNRSAFVVKYPAPDGHWLDGHEFTIKAASINVTGTKSCQFTLSELGRTDARCVGCYWRASDAKAN